VIVATKVGSDMGQGHKVLRKDYVLRAAEASLRRLQVECIDLYQSHWDDENTPFEETLAAYDQLLRQGKVTAIGASNLTAQRLAQALDAARPACRARVALRTATSTSARASSGCRLCVRGDRRDHLLLARRGLPRRHYRSPADLGKSARAGA
jgi:aryl-alcohol dehydrogenase-like predicted oxidoreductase